MRAGRSEVVDIFRKWSEDGAPVRWEGSFAKFTFSSWGVILSADEHGLRAMARDKGSELAVRFTADLDFGYGDSRTFGGEREKFEDCVVIFFGAIPDEGEGEPDTIALAVLK